MLSVGLAGVIVKLPEPVLPVWFASPAKVAPAPAVPTFMLLL